MRINYMRLLTEDVPTLPAKYEIDMLYRKACNNDGCTLTKEEFLADLTHFLKIKTVAEFSFPNDNLLIIRSFGKYKIYELLKYFKIGTDVITINAEMLFQSWKPQNETTEITYEDFVREFRNIMSSMGRAESYFIYDKQITVQKYNK